MAKFIYSKYEGKKVRSYYSSTSLSGQYYILDVNLKENIFHLSLTNVKQSFCRDYLSLPCSPKKVLDLLGYNLDDFLDFYRIEEFLNDISERVKRDGNKIHAIFSGYFVVDYDLEIR